MSERKFYRFLLASILVEAIFLQACSSSSPTSEANPTPTAQPSPAAQPAPAPATAPAQQPAAAPKDPKAEAEEIFATRCSTCHGAQGLGDGAAAAALNPKPRNFQLADWQKSVTDEHIAKIIQEGGPAVGKSALMPPNPDLVSKPEVVAALVKHVRNLKK